MLRNVRDDHAENIHTLDLTPEPVSKSSFCCDTRGLSHELVVATKSGCHLNFCPEFGTRSLAAAVYKQTEEPLPLHDLRRRPNVSCINHSRKFDLIFASGRSSNETAAHAL